jgi:hypothetical protein
MESLPTRLRALVNRDTVYQNLMFVFCILFGLAMIANVQPAGDGVWFWYSWFFLGGKHLYADMHLALQPLFVLETAACMALLGKGWLVSKIPAVLHLLAYCFGLLLLARTSRLSDGAKAILLGYAFFASISFEAYAFDDYHVLADCFQIYSLVVLLVLQDAVSSRRVLGLAALLGGLTGLALTTRLNDGAALFVGVAIAISCMAPVKRLISVALFAVTAALTLVLIVKLTGDSLHDYAYNSIFHAAGSKGGTGHVLLYPLHLPVNTWRWLRDTWFREVIAWVVGTALAWVFLLRPLLKKQGVREVVQALVGVVLILLPLRPLYLATQDATFVMTFSALGVFLSYGLSAWVFFRFLRWLFAKGDSYVWDKREILLLIPTGQLASGSMSSGGTHTGLYGPIAILILLLPLCSPVRVRAQWASSTLLAIAMLMMVAAIHFRAVNPYSWHAYREKPMFAGRQWYRHPEYGPMLIDSEMLRFIEPVCAEVKASQESAQPGMDSSRSELLSLPYPFANYFCGIPPWNGYVQTFFDTTSSATMSGLMDELQRSPPQWIFYQRQLSNLRLHELAYNHGQPLPHRYLDQMIEGKLGDGEWKSVYTSAFEDRPDFSNEWILIRTR